jgi:hypothetical protein
MSSPTIPKTNFRLSGSDRPAVCAAALLLTLAAVRTAKAATVTVGGTCTVAKAVGSINAGANQSPCVHTGTYGINDTVTIPTGSFNIGSGITFTRSVTIHGGGKWDTFVQTTSSSALYAFQVLSPSIVVKIDNLFLSPAASSTTTGIVVWGKNDTNLNDNNLELNLVVISGFTNSGIINHGGRVLVQNSLIYLNSANFGGGVANTIDQNDNGTTAVGVFVSKYTAISINNAAINGGGVYNTGRIDLRSTLMQQNTATQGAAIFGSTSFTPNPSCNITRDIPTAAPSEFDDNIASQTCGIVASTVACTFHDSIGSGNSSPYCSSNTVNCPQ